MISFLEQQIRENKNANVTLTTMNQRFQTWGCKNVVTQDWRINWKKEEHMREVKGSTYKGSKRKHI